MVMGADHLPLMTARGGRDGGAAAATAAAAAEPLPHTTLSSWKDKTLKTGVALLELLRAVAPECVDAAEVLRGESAKDCKLNARYAISCAHKMGCKVFTSWEDIVECKPKMIMCLVCAAMAEDIRRRKAAGLTPRATPRR